MRHGNPMRRYLEAAVNEAQAVATEQVGYMLYVQRLSIARCLLVIGTAPLYEPVIDDAIAAYAQAWLRLPERAVAA